MPMTVPYIVFVYRLYDYGYGPRWVKNCLSTDFAAVMKWFYGNHKALNAGMCHFTCPGKDTGN